eukprot:702981-Hanusia_phi.AAC.5
MSFAASNDFCHAEMRECENEIKSGRTCSVDQDPDTESQSDRLMNLLFASNGSEDSKTAVR